jgi:hypothetical protein
MISVLYLEPPSKKRGKEREGERERKRVNYLEPPSKKGEVGYPIGYYRKGRNLDIKPCK